MTSAIEEVMSVNVRGGVRRREGAYMGRADGISEGVDRRFSRVLLSRAHSWFGKAWCP